VHKHCACAESGRPSKEESVVQLLTSASRLAQGGLSSGTAGPGEMPAGPAVKAGPLGVGLRVRVSVAAEVGAPLLVGESVSESVAVEGGPIAAIVGAKGLPIDRYRALHKRGTKEA